MLGLCESAKADVTNNKGRSRVNIIFLNMLLPLIKLLSSIITNFIVFRHIRVMKKSDYLGYGKVARDDFPLSFCDQTNFLRGGSICIDRFLHISNKIL